ncbi:mobile element protein [Streptomyces sp. ID05-26A]|nr:mobile element protein [Streptomyces sp. ID05-26A]
MPAPADPELLADPQELATRTGRAADNTELLERLRSASRKMRGDLRHPVRLVENDVIVLDGTGTSTLLLPVAPVTTVTSVKVNGSAVTDYEWSADGILERAAGWPYKLRAVEVVCTHGYAWEVLPRDIQDAVLDRAETGLNVTAGLRSMTVGGESVAFFEGGGVTQDWLDVVARHQLNRGDQS